MLAKDVEKRSAGKLRALIRVEKLRFREGRGLKCLGLPTSGIIYSKAASALRAAHFSAVFGNIYFSELCIPAYRSVQIGLP